MVQVRDGDKEGLASNGCPADLPKLCKEIHDCVPAHESCMSPENKEEEKQRTEKEEKREEEEEEKEEEEEEKEKEKEEKEKEKEEEEEKEEVEKKRKRMKRRVTGGVWGDITGKLIKFQFFAYFNLIKTAI